MPKCPVLSCPGAKFSGAKMSGAKLSDNSGYSTRGRNGQGMDNEKKQLTLIHDIQEQEMVVMLEDMEREGALTKH